MGALTGARQIWRDLTSQRLRTFLTTFGIVWGTVAVALLLAFGQGFHAQLAKSFAGLGDYIVIAWPSKTSLPWEGLGKGRRIQQTEEDMELLRQRAPDLLPVSGSDTLLLNYRDRTLRVDVSGVAPSFGDLRNMIANSGARWLNELDLEDKRRVAFVGDELAKDLFGERDPVGTSIQQVNSRSLVKGSRFSGGISSSARCTWFFWFISTPFLDRIMKC